DQIPRLCLCSGEQLKPHISSWLTYSLVYSGAVVYRCSSLRFSRSAACSTGNCDPRPTFAHALSRRRCTASKLYFHLLLLVRRSPLLRCLRRATAQRNTKMMTTPF